MKLPALLICIIICACLITGLQAQTIFTYGDHSVSKSEFEKAFNKNPDTTGNHAEKVKEYLNLYINYKLKLQAAYDEKLNNSQDLKNEAVNFRDQLTDNYINQQANLAQLVHEAFLRSQKDILVQQVFVETTDQDTTAALVDINKAYSELQSGKDFGKVAAQYSTDSATKAGNGTIGYITVFSLPYEMESLIYNTSPGSYSTVYHSKLGYHIFKNVSERPALGKRKIQQLVFPTPVFFNKAQIADAKSRADSAYNVIQKGTSFSALLPAFASNYSTYQDANVEEISVGEYDADFEKLVFNMEKPGDISKPFKTAYGYNIIKLEAVEPVVRSEDDVVGIGNLQTKVQNDKRLDVAKDKLYAKWFVEIGFKENAYIKNDLWIYTDSAVNTNELPAVYKNIRPATVLFQFTKQKVMVTDWMNYVRANQQPGSNSSAYPTLLNNFKKSTCDTYYINHIEDLYPSATEQIKEFNDANMLFAEMDKHVWNKAAKDSTGLLAYYNAHATNYKWQPGASVLVVSGTDEAMLNNAAEKIKQQPALWRAIIAGYNDELVADSNHFESGQLPVKSAVVMRKDFQSVVEKNESGDGYVFVHIYDVFNEPSQRNFTDAQGMVINDYQEQLEQQWLAELKKKYPVKVNEAVVAQVR